MTSVPAVYDIAIAWPPNRPPILVTAHFSGSLLFNSEAEAVLAEIAKIIASASEDK
jgi:beta-lactamase class A